MTQTNEELLTEQHRIMDAGIEGLVDGSGSRQELREGVYLLRKHIYVEEEYLFPVLDADESRGMALAQMKYEHGDMWPHIEQAVTLLEANAPLDDLFPLSQALMELLQGHNHKEEDAIYTAADRYTTDGGKPSLEELFSTNDIPESWKCLRAPDQPSEV